MSAPADVLHGLSSLCGPGGEVCDAAVVAAGEEAVQPEADVPHDVVVVAERAD